MQRHSCLRKGSRGSGRIRRDWTRQLALPAGRPPPRTRTGLTLAARLDRLLSLQGCRSVHGWGSSTNLSFRLREPFKTCTRATCGLVEGTFCAGLCTDGIMSLLMAVIGLALLPEIRGQVPSALGSPFLRDVSLVRSSDLYPFI